MRGSGTAVVLFAAFLFSACSPEQKLTALAVEDVESGLANPTGALENTDTMGLAYVILGTHHVLAVLIVSSSRLPGVDRSTLFEHGDIDNCTREVGASVEVDYQCLGHASGKLRIEAAGRFASANGDYDLSIGGASVSAGVTVRGAVAMRVQGVANPTRTERVIMNVTAIASGLPERFEAVHETGIVLDNDDQGERLMFVSRVLGETFAWSRRASTLDTEIIYSIQDRNNYWDCSSRVEDRRITESECRTPIGQGDFAALRF